MSSTTDKTSPPENDASKPEDSSEVYERFQERLKHPRKNGKKWKVKLKSKWRDFLGHANSTTSQVADIMLSLRSLRNNPKPGDYLAAAMKVGGVALNNFVEFEDPPVIDPLAEYLEAMNHEYWDLSAESFCGSTIMEVIKRELATNIKTVFSQEDKSGNTYQIFSVNLDGNELFWADGANMDIDGPWVRSDKIDEIYKSIGNFIWKRIGSNHCQAVEDKDGNYSFVDDILAEKTLPSKYADEAVVRINKYLKHPEVGPTITRALLFFGRPGTGKSTCVRAIAQGLDMRSLRLPFYAIDEDVSTSLIPSLKILRPEVVIIDDVDRSRDQELLLEQLEMFRQHVRVVLATANYPEQIDNAILRPGRFDEAIQLEKLDAEIIATMIGEDVPIEYREKLGEMPIAYLNEFSLCRKVLGDKEAFARVEDLHARIEMGCEPEYRKRRR